MNLKNTNAMPAPKFDRFCLLLADTEIDHFDKNGKGQVFLFDVTGENRDQSFEPFFLFLHYFLNPTNLTTFQTDFNPMRVSRRFRKNVFHYALG